MEKKQHWLVAGATGLVGREVVNILRAMPGVEVHALVRDTRSLQPGDNVQVVPLSWDNLGDLSRIGREIPAHFAVCCLGTTRRKAGSAQAFLKVDRDYVMRLIDAIRFNSPHAFFSMISSVGADKPMGLYLNAKAEVEEHLRNSQLSGLVVRPSLLMGEREEERFGEQLGQKFMAPAWNLMEKICQPESALFWKYRPIPAKKVAEALVHGSLALAGTQSLHIREGKWLFEQAFKG